MSKSTRSRWRHKTESKQNWACLQYVYHNIPNTYNVRPSVQRLQNRRNWPEHRLKNISKSTSEWVFSNGLVKVRTSTQMRRCGGTIRGMCLSKCDKSKKRTGQNSSTMIWDMLVIHAIIGCIFLSGFHFFCILAWWIWLYFKTCSLGEIDCWSDWSNAQNEEVTTKL